MHNKILLPLIACLLFGCADFSPQTRRQHANALASVQGWQKLRLPTRDFDLAAYVPAALSATNILTVYIEGDGLAWLSPSQASDDPTPLNPIALELALRHPQGNAVYLARPCQFAEAADQRGCNTAYWTDRRFASQVIEASSQAIDVLKRRYAARQLILVGYSGGGAVAALVAARRTDVVRLVTVAGNLDHLAWTRLHGVPPLTGSLNPADAWESLAHLPQLHFVGGKDTNITPRVVESYRSRFPSSRQPEVHVIEDFTHTCCWVAQWPALWTKGSPGTSSSPATDKAQVAD